MKSNTKKRLIAFMLCMVLVLSSATSAFADEPQNTDSQSQAEVVTEPTADEPQNTDSQSQAEVVTEPAADEATEDTTTEDVSTENTITEDVSDTPDIEIPSKKEWSVQVGNATVKVNGSADALPADAQLSVTEITSEDEVKEIEKAVEEKAIEEQFSIKNIFSYDIKFLVNGSEVQPTTPVQVSVDTPEIVSNENTAVLHVDDNNVAEDMNGAVDGEGKVVFDAPHFSKYVIVQKGKSKVNVTIEYYDDTGGEYQIINSASTPVQPPTPGIVETKKELSHEKYIAKNEDGTYNLTLNVSGAVGSESYANKLDVLFVMDTSNSMKRGMDSSRDQNNYTTNSSSRFYNQQKAVEDAVAKLKNKKNVDAQFAVVAFDTQAGIKTDWTKGSITYPTRV